MTVIDPFGGVALGGFDCAWMGGHWIGCELEARFCGLAEQNIALWRKRFGHVAGYGSARIVQGDSRRLSEVIREAGLCISSPPFGDSLYEFNQNRTDGMAQIAKRPWMKGMDGETKYGATPGNLGNLKADEAGLDLVISSPPFAESLASDDPDKRGGLYRDPKRRNDKTLTATYGKTEGQLGAMKGEGFEASLVVSSPPYEGSHIGADDNPYAHTNGKSMGQVRNAHLVGSNNYGKGSENLGNAADFWTAARQILEQTYLVLAPGAHAIFVLKGFVRKGKYVDFPDQWRRLCESAGFATLHWHRSWLVEPGNVQPNMLGEQDKDHTVERKSFFRRLAESKGSPPIDYEVVLCMVKAG